VKSGQEHEDRRAAKTDGGDLVRSGEGSSTSIAQTMGEGAGKRLEEGSQAPLSCAQWGH